MLSSGILDFAIGLVFTFLAVSLAAGAATETVSSILKWRSHTLLSGIKALLNDPNATALAGELYRHGLINARSDGSKATNWRTNPAYIDATHFATALVDVVKNLPNTPPAAGSPAPPPTAPSGPAVVTALNAQIANIPGDASGQLRRMLYGIVERAQGDEDKIRAELSMWFDNAMDRVSGAYKRWAQLWSFIFALIIAVLLNISTTDVAKSLWRNPTDAKKIAATYDPSKITDATKVDLYSTFELLDTMPIGWAIVPQNTAPEAAEKLDTFYNFFTFVPGHWSWTRVFGWIITAFATLFGAPFWFDALQQIIRLKGSGPSPSEKQQQSAAAG